MIHLVTSENRGRYARALAEMHRLRREIFVDQKGWKLPVREDGGEYDQYDTADTLYFLALDRDGSIEVSARCHPTARGSILADHFPHLVDDDERPVAEPGVWEFSRYFSHGEAAGPKGFGRRAELRLAILEAAVDFGISRMVGMTDTFFYDPFARSGWNVRVLGLPAAYDEGEAVAFEVTTTDRDLHQMQERTAIYERQLTLSGPAFEDRAAAAFVGQPPMPPLRQAAGQRRRA